MRVFVTGTAGQLGHDVAEELERRGHSAISSDVKPADLPARTKPLGMTIPDPLFVPMDITDRDQVMSTIECLHPDAIIHCAAWTDVDGAEAEENRTMVFRINAEGTRNIAEAAKAVDAKMIYISTDYVFDGKGTRPWEPDDKCFAPLSAPR